MPDSHPKIDIIIVDRAATASLRDAVRGGAHLLLVSAAGLVVEEALGRKLVLRVLLEAVEVAAAVVRLAVLARVCRVVFDGGVSATS